MSRRILTGAIPVAISLIAFFAGCEGPEGPMGPSGAPFVYVEGEIYGYPQDSTSRALVQVLNNPGIPSVEINGIRIPPFPTDLPPHVFRGELPILPGDSAHLRVSYPKTDGSLGVAGATVILPGPFEIVRPDTSYDTISISLGDSLTVRWNSARGADIYTVWLYFEYHYIDTSGMDGSFTYSTTIQSDDTSITFAHTELFPDLEHIDSIRSEFGHIEVSAVSGPVREMQPGNVTGDGIGFFNGRTYAGRVIIRTGG